MKIIDFYKEQKRKENEEILDAIEKHSKSKECFFCGKKMSEPCKSHTVPVFILKSISEKNIVCFGQELSEIEIDGLDKKKSEKKSYLFRLLCNKCDKEYFKHYEDPNNLINYDSLDNNLRKIVLCEMAIKARLSHIYLKRRIMVTKDIGSLGRFAQLEQEGKLFFVERLEIEEHEKAIDKLKKTIGTNKNPFLVLLDCTLDYKIKLATQTVIYFSYDLNGCKLINADCNKLVYFYLMLLPLKGKTKVLFYVEKDCANNVQTLINQFNELTNEEKIHFLFVSLIAHDEQFFVSPSLANAMKKDKKIVKLYMKTETDASKTSAIKNYKKYTNYLLKEQNKKS